MKNVSVAIILMVMAGCLSAQSLKHPPVITGNVLDAESNSPLVGAHILVKETGQVITSTQSGEYNVQNLSPGSYVLRASFIGYESTSREVRIREGATLTANFFLESQSLQNPPVVYTTQPYELPGSHVLDESFLRNSGGVNVGEVIQSAPGVQIVDEGSPGKKKIASIRGCRPEHVIVLLDGIPLNDGNGSAVDLSGIPLKGIQQIEIQAGTGPEGGPGGIGGVIKIKSSPGYNSSPLTLNTSIELQSYDTESLDLNLVVNTGKYQLSGYGRFLNTDGDFKYLDERGKEKTRYNNSVWRNLGFVNGRVNLSTDWEIKSTISFDQSEAGSPSLLYQAPTPEAEQHENNYRFYTSIQNNGFRNNFQVDLFYQFKEKSFINPREQEIPETGEIVLHSPVDILEKDNRMGLKVLLNNDRGMNESRHGYYGIELGTMLERYTSEDRILQNERLPDGTNRWLACIKGFYDYSVFFKGIRWNTRGTLRSDNYRDYPGKYVSPLSPESSQYLSSQVRSAISPEESRNGWMYNLFISAGNNYAPPSFTSTFLVESIYAVGNPDLKPERAVEVSIGSGIFFRGSNVFELTCSAFRRNIEDKITWRRNFRGQYKPENTDQVEASGVEIYSRLKTFSERLTLSTTYAFQKVINSDSSSPYYLNFIPFQPEYYGSFQLGYDLNFLRLMLDSRYSGRRYTTESNLDYRNTSGGGLEPYIVYDLAVSRGFTPWNTNFEIIAGIDNVFDTSYELIDRMPMPGRIWLLRVSLTYNKR